MSDISTLPTHVLRPEETARVVRTIFMLRAHNPSEEHFYADLRKPIRALPDAVRDFVRRIREDDLSGGLIAGLPVDDHRIGPTPASWKAANKSRTRREQIWIALLSSVLGDVMAFASLQNGSLVQHVVAIPGQGDAQTGHGQTALAWHTEDAFAACRSDFVILMGLRNHTEVPTYFASLRDIRLDAHEERVLRQPRFLIRADEEHARNLNGLNAETDALVPIIAGSSSRPTLRFDLPNMATLDGDVLAQGALTSLTAELERVRQNFILKPGSVLVVNNRVAAHGRAAWKARWDGTDRWLLKVTVGDLEARRDYRRSRTSRVLHLDWGNASA